MLSRRFTFFCLSPMRHRPLIIAGILEICALILANMHAMGGIRTDEAKYLLNIPYPHPPFFRTLMNLTEWLPFQEMLWRTLLATALLQAVWLVWDMGRDLSEEKRIALAGGWLLSGGVILQAGVIMLAPVTALFGIVFLWLLHRAELVQRYSGLVAILWLISLLSSFQAFLYLPIVWMIFRRAQLSFRQTSIFLLLPVILLILCTISNPLSLATIVIHSSEGARVSSSADFLARFSGVFRLWLAAGGMMIGLVGTWGIVSSRNFPLIASFALVILYCTLSIPYPFYAILFCPFFVAGIHSFLQKSRRWETFPLLATFAAGAVVISFLYFPDLTPGASREVMQAIRAQAETGDILIAGSFGHDWQYESIFPVRRFVPSALGNAQAVICLSECGNIDDRGWKRLPGVSVEVWVRR